MASEVAQTNCVFCKILAGELPASVIYEDDTVIVIVDLQPINEGHLLVIPRVHTAEMQDVEPETLKNMMAVAQRMNVALRNSSLPCDGVNLFLADGAAAGQEVFHTHLHVYPRYTGDKFGFRSDKSRHFIISKRARMDEIAAELRVSMS